VSAKLSFAGAEASENRLVARLRHAFDRVRRHQIDDKREFGGSEGSDPQDAYAARLDQPDDRLGRTCQNGAGIAPQLAAVVGDKPRPGVD
jgi:hypothetical protein